MPQYRDVVVVAGGDPPVASARRLVPPGAVVVAADSGLDHATALGLRPRVVVGDMDSVNPDLLAGLDETVVVERHPVGKDATDLELAVRTAVAMGVDRLWVIGGHGGRLDHLLANVALLAHEQLADVAVRWLAGADLVVPVHDRVTIDGHPGALVSLVPVGGPAGGVTTRGLVWELTDERLAPGSTRSISNRFVGTTATIGLREGVLVVITPWDPDR